MKPETAKVLAGIAVIGGTLLGTCISVGTVVVVVVLILRGMGVIGG